jgi:deazaflavin-dependent oxidoreductase (nitroreductase family)
MSVFIRTFFRCRVFVDLLLTAAAYGGRMTAETNAEKPAITEMPDEWWKAIQIAASKGGSSREPVWARNVRANPDVTLQDGNVVRRFTAREVSGKERDVWWERAVAAQPAMQGYAAATDRLIPLFVLDPAW